MLLRPGLRLEPLLARGGRSRVRGRRGSATTPSASAVLHRRARQRHVPARPEAPLDRATCHLALGEVAGRVPVVVARLVAVDRARIPA
ncbi:MAG TPA: hypothetical protein VJT72_06075, partial [Pseudonocardiaceae bacterium]|nr:hypothetical protein [Pseudonocardiaceae bacterium]